MQPRALIAVLITLVAIIGAGYWLVNWSGGDDEGAESTETTTTVAESTTTITAAPAPTPDECSSGNAVPTTTTAPSTSSTTTAAPGDPATTLPPVPTGPTLDDRSTVSTVGLDEVTFGLTVSQAESAAGTPMIPCEPAAQCYRVIPAVAPPGITFTVTEGTIERVDITDEPITTRSGVGVSTTGDEVAELFGDSLERTVNDDGSVDLIFVPSSESDADFRVVFTLRDEVVESYRSGRLPGILDRFPCAGEGADQPSDGSGSSSS